MVGPARRVVNARSARGSRRAKGDRDEHRQRRLHALSDFGILSNDRHDAVGRHPNEGVRKKISGRPAPRFERR